MNKKIIKLNRNTEIDLSKLIDSRLLVQANSGGGKSWLLRRILEQSHGKVQQIIIDLEGEFSTLREKYDYVLAGKGGDTPATPQSAGLLARKLLELNVSAIIDLYELPHHERKRFVRLFLESMVNAPKELWHPVMVIIDEAHVFAPEKGQSEAMEAVIDLATRGRKRGYCAVLATQRLSKLHKDAAAECNNKLIGRTGLDIDMKRAAEELGFTKKEQYLSLRSLAPGEFYAFGPALSTNVERVKVGDVQTSHPKAGSRSLTKTVPPTNKIKKVLGKLADLPAEAQKEAHTVKELKAQFAESQRENRRLKSQPTTQTKADPAAIERAVAVAVKQTEAKFATKIKEWSAYAKKLRGVLASIGIALGKAQTLGNPPDEVVAAYVTPKFTATVKVEPTPPKPRGLIPDTINIDEANGERPVQGGARRMLEVLVSRYPIELTKSQLGTFSRMKPRGGSFGTYLSTLKGNGFIEQNGNLLKATETGIAFIGHEPEPPQTPEEVIEMWRNNLTGGARRMFDVLIENYPETLSKEMLGEMAGVTPTGGSFGTYLSTLKSNGLAEVTSEGIKVSETLFMQN